MRLVAASRPNLAAKNKPQRKGAFTPEQTAPPSLKTAEGDWRLIPDAARSAGRKSKFLAVAV